MDGALEWSEVAARLGAASCWWVSTAGADGPHAVPVWGVVVDGAPWFYGDPGAVRSKALAHDPRCVVHLESASQVLIVRGTAARTGAPDLTPDVAGAYRAKYTAPGEVPFLPDEPAMAGVELYRVTPSSALTWDAADFFGSHRRWPPAR